jgi:SAM-dependent methyltransferase
MLYKALALPVVYRVWGRLVGGKDPAAFPREHIRARAGQRVLDIGCGPADILKQLPNVDYTGFDANPDYITTATRNYGNRGRFYCQRVSEESLGDHEGFDIVLAIGVLHHLDDAEAEKLFRLAHAALVPGGRLVTLDGVFAEGQSRIARLIISRDRGEYVRDERGYRTIADRVFTKIKPVVRHDLLTIPYTHLIMECEK